MSVAATGYSFMRLWNMPESSQLEAQLLAKLCDAPWRPTDNAPPPANNARAALQPLLDDLVLEESYLEIRQPSNQAEQVVFTIRLNQTQAGVWVVNLAEVLSSIEGAYPTKRDRGWSFTGPRTKTVYEMDRIHDWIIFGMTKGRNDLFYKTVTQIEREEEPFRSTNSNHWLTAEADLKWVAQKFQTNSSQDMDLPRVSLTLTGDGANAITTGEFTFSQPLALNLETWNFPDAQMMQPVVGFGALRGLGPWLTETKLWKSLELGSAPNMFFTWADARAPMQIHIASPTQSSKQITDAVGTKLTARANEWLAEYALGSIERWPDTTGVVWKNLPMVAPYLTSTNTGWLEAGITPVVLPAANTPEIYLRPSVPQLMTELSKQTNLVAFQWETTGNRTESVHVLGQLFRAILRHPQMPANTASSQWLQAARNRLGNCTTKITLAAPNKLAFERKSTTGFTAFELHLIADWVESPKFPHGFYSTLSPVGPPLTPTKQ